MVPFKPTRRFYPFYPILPPRRLDSHVLMGFFRENHIFDLPDSLILRDHMNYYALEACFLDFFARLIADLIFGIKC